MKAKHAKRFRQFVFCEIGVSYKPHMALADLIQITTQMQPSVIISAWKSVMKIAEERVAAHIDAATDDENDDDLPLHKGDCEIMSN